jgi:hypothetical protein
LNGAVIARELRAPIELSAYPDAKFRIEIVPPDQVAAADRDKIRVSITHSLVSPYTNCSGTPFLFRVVAGEEFTDTKVRLIERAKIDGATAKFGYTNNATSPKKYQHLKDSDVLSDLLDGDDTMLYIFLPGSVKQRSVWNRGLKIYN